MDFSLGGTNIPHHHDNQEEIYYILRGHGDMVAGGGVDGNEGDTRPKRETLISSAEYYCRFYSASKEGDPHDLVLAVRSTYPEWRGVAAATRRRFPKTHETGMGAAAGANAAAVQTGDSPSGPSGDGVERLAARHGSQWGFSAMYSRISLRPARLLSAAAWAIVAAGICFPQGPPPKRLRRQPGIG